MTQRARVVRRFHCRRGLWSAFERAAEARERAVDELINEAMEAWARGQKLAIDERDDEITEELEFDTPPPELRASGRIDDSRTQVVTARPPPRLPGDTAPTWTPLQTPAVRPLKPGTGPHGAAAGRTLFLLYRDQRVRVDGDQFVIGRGSKVSDFVIKDVNVSRRHAAIIRRNGLYHLQDLGSTNGIEYKGMRIDNKRIDDGDVFRICDHELRFSFGD